MKKIAVMLAILMAFTVCLCACSTETEATAEASQETVASEAAETSAEESASEDAQASGGYTIGILPFWTGCSWFDPFTAGGKWYLEAQGNEVVVENAQWDTVKYNQICQTWANDEDLDAVIAAPLSGEEVAVGLKAIADSGKVLAITNNEAGYLPEAIFCVSYDGVEACTYMGERVVETLQEQNGELKGTVLLDLGDIENPEHVERADAIKAVMAEYPDLTVREFESDMMVDTATERAGDLLRTTDDVVAIVGIGQSSFIGIVNALEREGMAYPQGDENHIVCAGMDTAADVINPAIADGVVDFAIDQPVLAYNAIAGYYLVEYLKNGEAALPQPGDIITAEDIDIQVPLPVEELDIMTPPDSWAPAEVIDRTEEYGHIWIKVSYTVVDQSNIDDPLIYSNISNYITDWGF